jgi:hypothetical protein
MSAYICDKEHIVYLVAAAMSKELNPHGGHESWYHNSLRHELPRGDFDRASEVANMLWLENIKSVSYRYPNESGSTLPGPIGENFVITPADIPACLAEIKPVQVLKSCDCYAYQTCEHPEWKQSESHAFIQSLRSSAWHSLPGYDSAEWGAPAIKTLKTIWDVETPEAGQQYLICPPPKRRR